MSGGIASVAHSVCPETSSGKAQHHQLAGILHRQGPHQGLVQQAEIVEFAPMASASVSTATAVNMGLRARPRTP